MAYVIGSDAGTRELFASLTGPLRGHPPGRPEASEREPPIIPFFSPDGQWLGYVTRGEMKKVSVTGGAPITLAEVQFSRGASMGRPTGRSSSPARTADRACLEDPGGRG